MMDGGMAGGGMMGGMGLFWLIVSAVIWVAPLYRLLPKAGLNRNLAFIAIVPPAGLILLWVLAFRRWPGDADASVVR